MSKRWLCNICNKEVPSEAPSERRHYYGFLEEKEVMLSIEIWVDDSLLTCVDRVCDSCCLMILEEGERGGKWA